MVYVQAVRLSGTINKANLESPNLVRSAYAVVRITSQFTLGRLRMTQF